MHLCETWPLSVNIHIGCRRVPCAFIIITTCNGLFSQKTRKSTLWLNGKIDNLLVYYLHFAPTLFCVLLNILPAPTATTSCHLISHEAAPTVDNDPDKRSGLIEPSSVGQSAPTQVQHLSVCLFCTSSTVSVLSLPDSEGKLRFIWCVWYSDNDTGKKTNKWKNHVFHGSQIKLCSDMYFSTEHHKQIDWFFFFLELTVLLLLKES